MSTWNTRTGDSSTRSEFDRNVDDPFNSPHDAGNNADHFPTHDSLNTFPPPRQFHDFHNYNESNPDSAANATNFPEPRAQPPPTAPPPRASPPNPSSPHTTPPAPPPNTGKTEAPKRQSGPSYMMLGTLAVIGAMAANVLGFRRSRWAVGKDVHRAWENYEHAARRRAAAEAAESSAARAQMRPEENPFRKAREAFERAESEAQEQFQQAVRQAHAQRDRSARESTREKHEAWERSFRGADGTTYRTSGRIEFDERAFEKVMGGRSGGQSGGRSGGRSGGSSDDTREPNGNENRNENQSRSQNPFGMPDEVLEEILKTARAQAEEMQRNMQEGRGGSEKGDFGFWQRMNDSQEFRTGFGDTNDEQSSRSGAGIFERWGMARFYSVLGLENGASDAQVKAAYRKEVMKWHPDRYRGNDKEEAERKFREVTDAYNALTGK